MNAELDTTQHGASCDEEEALLSSFPAYYSEETAPSSSSANSESNETFKIPNLNVKRRHKMLLGSLAIVILMLVCYSTMPLAAFRDGGIQLQAVQTIGKIGLNDQLQPVVALPDGVRSLPEGVEIFTGNSPLNVKEIPHQSDKVVEDKVNPIGSGHNGLLLCSAEVNIVPTAYMPPDGCAFLSDLDITYTGEFAKSPANLVTICASNSIGHFPVDPETLESYGLFKDGVSMISAVVPGAFTSVAVFDGEVFDGKEVMIEYKAKPTPLMQYKYVHPHGTTTANDNVNSLVFYSTAASIPRNCKEVKKLVGYTTFEKKAELKLKSKF